MAPDELLATVSALGRDRPEPGVPAIPDELLEAASVPVGGWGPGEPMG